MRLVLVALAALLLLPSASAVIATSPTRLDVQVATDAPVERAITVLNKGGEATSVEVHVLTFEGEDVQVEPASLTLAPGEQRDVTVRLRVAANTSGGRHDPRIELIEVPVHGTGAAVGRAAVSVPLVFWVENLKLGSLTVRHTPGAALADVRVLTQNFLPATAAPQVDLALVDATGAVVATATAQGPAAEPNASASFDTQLPLPGVVAGRYTLVARATHEGHESNAIHLPLVIGKRSLSITSAQAGASPGATSFRVVVTNDGDVPLGGTLVVEAGALSLDAPVAALAPGESRAVEISGAALPGPWRALVRWDGGEAALAGEALIAESTAPVPAPGILLVLALAAVALLRRR